MWGCSHKLQQQRTTSRSWSSLYSRWVLGAKHRLASLAASNHTHWAISAPKLAFFKKNISNSKHWVFHNEHRKIIIFSWSRPVAGRTKKDKAEFTKHERNCQGLTQGDPACCGDRVLRDTKSRKAYPFSLCSASAQGLFCPRGNSPDGVFTSLMLAYLPALQRLKALCRKWYSVLIE